jgi:hypothetical protein
MLRRSWSELANLSTLWLLVLSLPLSLPNLLLLAFLSLAAGARLNLALSILVSDVSYENDLSGHASP